MDNWNIVPFLTDLSTINSMGTSDLVIPNGLQNIKYFIAITNLYSYLSTCFFLQDLTSAKIYRWPDFNETGPNEILNSS